jgi:hypothetical protein
MNSREEATQHSDKLGLDESGSHSVTSSHTHGVLHRHNCRLRSSKHVREAPRSDRIVGLWFFHVCSLPGYATEMCSYRQQPKLKASLSNKMVHKPVFVPLYALPGRWIWKAGRINWFSRNRDFGTHGLRLSEVHLRHSAQRKGGVSSRFGQKDYSGSHCGARGCALWGVGCSGISSGRL